ncbi:MAG TPA: hypothetical protein VFN50_06640 [Acidimicrobiales bacterium]|nr:hypothetical protein [Acidimicrobiales bacterium]
MSGLPPQRGSEEFGGFLPDSTYAPLPSRSDRTPKVWGSIRVDGGTVVAELRGWRAVVAMKRSVELPVSSVVRVVHDPACREHVQAKLRKRAGRSGVVRVGVYHSVDGWSFWSVGMGRNAVVVESVGTRYRFVVIEVADPVAVVDEVARAAGLAGRDGPEVPPGPMLPG